MKHRILLAVDGSQSSLRGVKHVIGMARKAGPFDLHLLNVSPEISEDFVDVLGREEVDQDLAAEGKTALVHAERLLDEAGLAYSSHIEIGRPSHVIATFARENACDQIVMGTHGKGTLRSVVVGSVAMRVVALADVPVTVVK
jgi:nucleotide-binding universal stress UspA family protein